MELVGKDEPCFNSIALCGHTFRNDNPHRKKWLLYNSILNVCVFIFIESKAVESGEGETQSSSYLMLTSAAGLNIIRHLQENSLCELSLQYLFEVCVASVIITDFKQLQRRPQGNNRPKKSWELLDFFERGPWNFSRK